MSSLTLEQAQIVDISQTLAHWAVAGNVNTNMLMAVLDLSPTRFRPNQSANDLWFEITQMIHAGGSKNAGYGTDAVGRLIGELAQQLRGNTKLRNLAYDLSKSTAQLQVTTAKSIFLSYATPDRADVDLLHAALTKNAPQIQLFQDYRSVKPGADWYEVIRDAAGSSSLLVAWLTQNYLDSAFCQYEIGVAESRGSTIIPILVEPTVANKAPAYLAQRQSLIPGQTMDFDAIATKLLASLP